MQQRSNLNPWAIVTIIFCLSLLINGCDSFSSMTDVEHVARAKEYRDKGDLRTSVIELKSALQKNPENVEARRLLGMISIKLGDGPTAEKELRRALELGIKKEAVLLPLAEALQLQGKNQQILDEIDDPLSLNPQDRARLVAYRGDAWLALDKAEKARAEYARALQADAQSALAKLGLAKLAAVDKDIKKAFQLLDEALKAAPEEARIWSFQADLYNNQGDKEKAQDSYSKAIHYRVRNQADRTKRALIRIDLKDYEGAAKDIQILKKQAPNYYLMHYANGLLALQQKKPSEAQVAFEQAIKLNSGHILTYYFLGVAHLMQNHLAQAEHNLSRFVAMFPNLVQPRQLLALTQFKLRDFERAKGTLLPIAENMPDDLFSLKLMGNIEFALGNDQQGLDYLQRVAELEPDLPLSHARLGLGKLASGEAKEAVKDLERAVDLDPKFAQAEVLIAYTHIRAKEYDKALGIINSLREKEPESPVPLNLLGLIHLGQGDIAKAKSAFEKAIAQSPGDPSASHNLAQLLIQEKKLEEARQLYQQVLKVYPNDLRTQLKLAELDAREGKAKEMEEGLKRAIEAYPQALQPRLMLGRYYLQQGEAARTLALLENVRSRYADNPQMLVLLAEAQLADKQPARALETANALVRNAQKSALAQFILSKAYAENQDSKNMRAALERSLEIDPQNVSVLNNLAWALRKEDPDKALPYAEKALKQAPKLAPVMDTLAMILLEKSQNERALRLMEQAIALAPDEPLFQYHLSIVQEKNGQIDEAIKTLKKLLNAQRDFKERAEAEALLKNLLG